MGVNLVQGTTVGGVWQLIRAGTGACDITTIPTGYKFLRLEWVGNSGAGNQVHMTFNNDTGGHYFSDTGHGEAYITLAAEGQAFQGMIAIDIANLPTELKQICGSSTIHMGGTTNDVDYTPVTGTWVKSPAEEINRITITVGTGLYWVLYGVALP